MGRVTGQVPMRSPGSSGDRTPPTPELPWDVRPDHGRNAPVPAFGAEAQAVAAATWQTGSWREAQLRSARSRRRADTRYSHQYNSNQSHNPMTNSSASPMGYKMTLIWAVSDAGVVAVSEASASRISCNASFRARKVVTP